MNSDIKISPRLSQALNIKPTPVSVNNNAGQRKQAFEIQKKLTGKIHIKKNCGCGR